MTETSGPTLLIVADTPTALTDLCGVSLFERLRRIARQLGFREAMVLTNSSKPLENGARSAWRGEDVSLKFRERGSVDVTVGELLDCVSAMNISGDRRTLVLSSSFYCDARLVRALTEAATDSALIDSDPPSSTAPLWADSPHSFVRLADAALISTQWLAGKNRGSSFAQALRSDAQSNGVGVVDAAKLPGYVRSMRRTVRPVFFPAPSPEHHPVAERVLIDATQKGVLDFPAVVHAPIEKWLVSHLCRKSITPNQVTLGTAIVGLSVTFFYAFGYLWIGALLALAVGILDGVDGKLARLKVQTTKAGKGEHTLDYFVELSWWAALAYHFHSTGEVPSAFLLLLFLFGSELLDRIARRSIEPRLNRSLDDVSQFDRAVRLFAGRRNIYTWLFTFCLIIREPAFGFVCLCLWGVVSSAIHVFRAAQLRISGRQSA